MDEIKTKRNHGGQPGNHNALKHGFYSKNFSAAERKNLRDDPNMKNEIEAARVIAQRIMKRINQKGLSQEETGEIDDRTRNTINTLNNLLATIGNLERTHYVVVGKDSPVENAIMEALREVNIEQGYNDV